MCYIVKVVFEVSVVIESKSMQRRKNMTMKKIRLATLIFIFEIVVLIVFVIQEKNIIDFVYLLLIIFYFVRFLMMKHSN